MGKLLIQQRRGKGSVSYRAPSHRYKLKLDYKRFEGAERSGFLRGQVVEFIDDPARGALAMKVLFEDKSTLYLLAPEGISIGSEIYSGADAPLGLGNCLPIGKMPEGAPIYNIEIAPGAGPRLVRAPGSYATVISKEKNIAYIKLPSKKSLALDANCRAQLGVVSGGGRLEMPLLKAGANFYKKHAQNRKWPVGRGVKKCAYSHPFGGKEHHRGRGSMTSRNAPPGRKVGHIAARSTGRKKAKIEEEKFAEGE